MALEDGEEMWEISSGWAAIIGAVVGGVFSGLVPALAEGRRVRWQAKHEQRREVGAAISSLGLALGKTLEAETQQELIAAHAEAWVPVMRLEVLIDKKDSDVLFIATTSMNVAAMRPVRDNTPDILGAATTALGRWFRGECTGAGAKEEFLAAVDESSRK